MEIYAQQQPYICYLLALQNEELNKDQIQELVKKCEGLIKLQEEMEQTRYSKKTLKKSTLWQYY